VDPGKSGGHAFSAQLHGFRVLEQGKAAPMKAAIDKRWGARSIAGHPAIQVPKKTPPNRARRLLGPWAGAGRRLGGGGRWERGPNQLKDLVEGPASQPVRAICKPCRRAAAAVATGRGQEAEVGTSAGVPRFCPPVTGILQPRMPFVAGSARRPIGRPTISPFFAWPERHDRRLLNGQPFRGFSSTPPPKP